LIAHLRASFRILLLSLWTGFVYLAWILSRVLLLLPGRLADRAHAGLVRLWARGVNRLLGIRVSVDGEIPEPPFFLVSNHLSYVDIVVYDSVVPCRFLAKSEVANWPVLGFLARTTGTHFVDRERRADLPRVVEALSRSLERGHGIALFPEGTSSGGDDVLPFKSSVFEVASQLEMDVSCAAVTYRMPEGAPPAAEAVCWWGDMTFGRHFYGILGLSGFEAQVAFAPAPVSAGDRKHLARSTQAVVRDLFVPVTP
jgi:1-acyl-sn-glycerol-3-phosphate acyltransferase